VLEGVVLICVCYSCPGNVYNLAKCFDQPQSVILEIVNEFMALMDAQWVHTLDFDPILLLPDNLDKYAATILDCRAPMRSI
jgi:hypothetical protein